MPAKSVAQQRLMALVNLHQAGKLKNPSAKIKEMAERISKEDAKDFARTKHEGLPEKKESSSHGHYRNTCPKCGCTEQCRCMSKNKEIRNELCWTCKQEKEAGKGEFSQPENWDVCKEHSTDDYRVFVGANDWEDWGWTAAAVERDRYGRKQRVWIEIDYSKFPEKAMGSLKATSETEAWGKKAVEKWLEEARKLAKKSDDYETDDGKFFEALLPAAKSDALKPYVAGCGKETMTWKKTSAAQRLEGAALIKIGAQAREDDESETREKPKKKRSILPWMLLGGGAGLGLAGATMYSPQFRDALDRFKGGAKEWATKKDPAKALHDYVDRGSDLMQQKFWGVIPARKAVEWARKSPGIDPKYRWDPGAANHYDAFVRGPLSGYLKLTEERMHDSAPAGIKGMLLSGYLNRTRARADKLMRDRGLREADMTPEQQKEVFGELNRFSIGSPIQSLQQKMFNKHMGNETVAQWGQQYSNDLIKPLEMAPWILGGLGALGVGAGTVMLANQD